MEEVVAGGAFFGHLPESLSLRPRGTLEEPALAEVHCYLPAGEALSSEPSSLARPLADRVRNLVAQHPTVGPQETHRSGNPGVSIPSNYLKKLSITFSCY